VIDQTQPKKTLNCRAEAALCNFLPNRQHLPAIKIFGPFSRHVHVVGTEWLLSTLFLRLPVSLEPPEHGGSFFGRIAFPVSSCSRGFARAADRHRAAITLRKPFCKDFARHCWTQTQPKSMLLTL
jgi:hypothetical protein